MFFFTKCDYYASATSLRTECEKQLQRLYPHNWTLKPKEDGTISILNLNSLSNKLEKFYDRFSLSPNPTSNIDQYKKRILNPSSHNDSKAKIFQSELTIAINEIANFQEIKKQKLMEVENVGQQKFKAVLDNNGKHIELVFLPLEQWSKLIYKNNEFYENINVNIESLVGMNMPFEDRLIKKVWDSICKFMSYPEESYPKMENFVTDIDSNLLLKNLNLPEKAGLVLPNNGFLYIINK